MNRPTRCGLAAAAAATMSGLLVSASGPVVAASAEVTRPAARASTMVLVGRGYGHGRGMSQWGAYGAAARHGLSWRRILSFYYPGTVATSQSNTTLKVWISEDRDANTTVLPVAGLTVTVAGRTLTVPVGASYRAWRAVGGISLSVQYRDARGTWRAFPSSLPKSTDVAFSSGPLTSYTRAARAMTRTVRLVLPSGRTRELRGVLHATVSGGTSRSILHSTMESYLRGVVPAEMPASWHTNALSAQAVAARTYAAAYRDRQRARKAAWDICDTISCQVFSGVAQYSLGGTRAAKEHPRTDAAIAAANGVVLRSSAARGAGLANTEFSAANGGYTVGGAAGYIVAKPDPYDGAVSNPSNSWTTSVSIATLQSRYRLGRLSEVRVLKRDGRGALGGRVLQLQLVGSSRTVTVTGAQLRSALRLKSDWFAFRSA
ncbi:MAG TPA: SpoIID/LytB domain-containing protein [Dermatophilaceae bacterium]|nr:SpoIID/LytB domain-containing protein [Dermatophilaceae bacterium]